MQFVASSVMFGGYVVVFCVLWSIVRSASVRNNVCTTFRAYGNLQNDRNCFYNPDLDSTPSDIAIRHGYALETYSTTTKDGYIISMFRVKKDSNQKDFGQPVIIQHGIIVDGLSWIISGNNSLGFNLVSNGFDVWLPNFRGSTFSAKHINPSISEKDYWNFSFHELGMYDLPAFVEKIAEVTKRNDIAYIGHSMGSTTALIYASSLREHCEKYLKGFILTAPVAYFKNVKGAIKTVLPFYPLLKQVLENLEVYAFGTFPALQSFLTGLVCKNYPNILICQILYSFATGLVVEQVRPEMLPVIIKFYPTGTPIKTVIHFTQIILANGRFQWFDYGKEKNLKLYNDTIPPIYDISTIRLPIHIFASSQDFLSDLGDSKTVYDKLTGPKGFHTYSLGHTDYLYGRHINKVYSDMVNVIRYNISMNYETNNVIT